MMKSFSYFKLKPFFVLNIFEFLSWLFGHVRKWLDKNLKNYDVTGREINNHNTYIAQCLNKVDQLIESNMRNIFLQKSCRQWESVVSDLFLIFKKALLS